MSLAGRLHVASRPQGPELSIASRCRQVQLSCPGNSNGLSYQCVRPGRISSSALNGGATAQPAAPDAPAAAGVRPASTVASQLQLQDRLQQNQQPQQQESSTCGRPVHVHQQQQQQQQQSSQPAAQHHFYPWQITGDINRARSVEQLQSVVQTYGPQFNHIHTSAAIVKLQRLWTSTSAGSSSSSSVDDTISSNGSSRNSWSSQQAEPSCRRRLLMQLLQLAQSLQRVDGRYCANVLYSLALIEQQGEPAAYCPPLIDQICAASFELVNSMNPQELATLLWSYGVLDILPGEQLLRRICFNILRHSHALTPQDLVMVLSGLPKVQQQQRVSPYHTVHKLAAAAAQKLQVASPLECALLLSGFASVSYQAPAQWLSNYYTCSHDKLCDMGVAALGMTGWALGQMSPLAQTPPTDWLCRYEGALLQHCIHGQQQQQQQQQQWQAFSASNSQAGRGDGNSCSSSSSSSGNSNLQPPAALVELTLGLYGWSKAAPGQPPSAAFQQLLFSTTQQVVHDSSSLTLQQQRQRQPHSEQLTVSASSLSFAVQQAQQAFLQQQDDASAQHGDSSRSSSGISTRVMVELLCAAARWRIIPPRLWLLAVLGQLQQHLTAGSCSSRDTSNLLWALATLGVRPNTAWLEQCLAALQQQLEQQQQRRRQKFVDRPWRRQGGLPPVVDDVDAQQSSVSKQLPVALWALHKLQYIVSCEDFWSCVWSLSQPLLTRHFRLSDISMLLEGALQQQQQPPGDWVETALTAVLQKVTGAAAELQQQQQSAAEAIGAHKHQHQQQHQQRKRARHQHAGVLKSSTDTISANVLRVASAAVQLRAAPGHRWCSEVVQALQPARHQFSQRNVCRFVSCLGKLGYRPAGSSLAPWLAAAVLQIHPNTISRSSNSATNNCTDVSSADMCLLLSGLRRCGVVMNSRWMSALLVQAQQHAADWPLQVVIQVLLYVKACRITPQPAWSAAMSQALETAVAAEQQQQHDLDAGMLKLPALLVAMVKLRVAPSAQLLHVLEQAAAATTTFPSASIRQRKQQAPDVESLLQQLRDPQKTSTTAAEQPSPQHRHELVQQRQQQDLLQVQQLTSAQAEQPQPSSSLQQQQQSSGMHDAVTGSTTQAHQQRHWLNGNSRPGHDTSPYVRSSSSRPDNSSASNEWAGALWVAGTARPSNIGDVSYPQQQLDLR